MSSAPVMHSTSPRRSSEKSHQHVSIDMEKQSGAGNRFGEGFDEKRRLVASDKTNESGSKSKDEKLAPVPFLGLDLQFYSITTQFCILSFGIFFFYLLYGIAMEQIFRYPGN